MPTYILLNSFTDQGIRNINDTVKRVNAFKEQATSKGAVVKDVYWTLGQYDTITVVDAADDTVATAVAMSLAKLGNVRTQTLRAFSQPQRSPYRQCVAGSGRRPPHQLRKLSQ